MSIQANSIQFTQRLPVQSAEVANSANYMRRTLGLRTVAIWVRVIPAYSVSYIEASSQYITGKSFWFSVKPLETLPPLFHFFPMKSVNHFRYFGLGRSFANLVLFMDQKSNGFQLKFGGEFTSIYLFLVGVVRGAMTPTAPSHPYSSAPNMSPCRSWMFTIMSSNFRECFKWR